MKFAVQLTEDDIGELAKLGHYLIPVYRRILYALAVVYVLAACYALYKAIVLGELDQDIIAALVTGLLLVFFFRRGFRRQMLKAYRQQKNLRDAFTIEFSEEGYFIDSPTGTTRLRWADIHGWRMVDKFLLLHQSEVLFNLLPFRVLDHSQDREKLLQLLQSRASDKKLP